MGSDHLSIPQSEAYHSLAKSTAVVAGFGSGKTFTAVTKAFQLLRNYPGIPVGYAAPTYGLIKDIFFPAVQEYADRHGYRIHLSKGDHVVTVLGLGKIVCRSLSNPDKIVGFEVGDFLLDEMDILKTDAAISGWRKCKARCRKKFPKRDIYDPLTKETVYKRKPNQMSVYTTPEGFKATYQLFKENPLPGSKLIQMSTMSNQANLPDDYIDELKANYPPQLIEAYIMGQFVNLTSGAVYTSFNRKLNDAPGIIPIKGEPIHIGMDFNVTNMSAVVNVIRRGYPIAAGELVKIYDTPAMIKVIRAIYGHQRLIYIYPDASGSGRHTANASISDLSLLRAAGFIVIVDSTNPAVKDRIISMNGMFHNAKGERRYRVNVAECPHYTRCLEQQSYDSNGLPDKASDFDHLPDAGGYFINKMFGITRATMGAGKVIM